MPARNLLLRASLRVLCPTICLHLAAGCAGRVKHGEETVYTGPAWIGILVILFGVLLILAGVLLRSEWRIRDRLAMACVGVALAVFGGPAVLATRVTVSPSHFEVGSGPWYWRTRDSIRFGDLRSASFVTKVELRRHSSYQLICHLKSGESIVFGVSEAMREALPEILGRSMKLGIPVEGLSNGRLPFEFEPIPRFD